MRSGHHYEFANDLLQECVHAALPPALALAYHRRAADLTSDRPEMMAEHAYAAGDEPRAAQGWLLAGEAALRRAAVEDALGLLDRSLAVETSFVGHAGAGAAGPRRPSTRPAPTSPPPSPTPTRRLALARQHRDRRLEMAALRFLGGDAAVGLGLTVDELVPPLEEGLRLAADLGDRRAEADFSSRLAILEASRLRLTTALARAERSVARAAVRRARRTPSSWPSTASRRCWPTSATPSRSARWSATSSPASGRAATPGCCSGWCSSRRSCRRPRAGWTTPGPVVAEALELNRLSGFPAYAGYLAAHDGWYARLSGDLDAARRIGREAVEATSPVEPPVVVRHRRRPAGRHPGRDRRPRRGRGRRPARAGGRRDRDGRRAAALPRRRWPPSATRDAAAEATRLLDEVECPPGHAWVTGADVYLLLGRPDLLTPAIQHSWPHLRRP